jgi:hypothetical protein
MDVIADGFLVEQHGSVKKFSGNMGRLNKLLMLVELAVTLAACSTQNRSLSHPISSTTPSFEKTSISSTYTPFPSQTPSPSASPSPSLAIASPTLGFPPGPTLTFEESQTELANRLQLGENCLFPCWWGIIPDVTSREDALGLFRYLNLQVSELQFPEGKIYEVVLVKDNAQIDGPITFTVSGQVVEDIHVRENKGINLVFEKNWAHYSFTEILKTYGQPTRFWVILATGGEAGQLKNSYYLLLFYDTVKALILYSGSTVSNNICPDFNNGEIGQLDIYLQSPDSSRKLTDNIDVKNMIELLDQPDVQYVEKLSDSQIDELYNLFNQSKDPSCFDVPLR